MSDLKPRAVAVLCALRNGGLSVTRIRDHIGDASTAATCELVDDMRAVKLIGQVAGDARWYITDSGIDWLYRHGLDATSSARLSAAQEAS